MAMIDYGAIAWKDGKLISTDMFTPMKDMVGWEDDDASENGLKGNYFAYIGDADLTIAFYKNVMRIYPSHFLNETSGVNFGWEKFEGWKKWEDNVWVDSLEDIVWITVRKRKFHDYYVCTMEYRGHKYKVAFGYGVDLGCYKRYHIIDYYRLPSVRIKNSWWKFKQWLKYDVWAYKYRYYYEKYKEKLNVKAILRRS